MTLFEQWSVVAMCVTNHVGSNTKIEVASTMTQVVLLFVV